MNNKASIELSTSFIVMLILAILVFGFGLVFVKNLFTEVGEIKANLDKTSEQEVLRLLDRGERVGFPITTKTVKGQALAVYALGIVNVKDEQDIFFVSLKCTGAVDTANNNIPNGCNGKWALDKDEAKEGYQQGSYALQKNEKKAIPVAIQPPSTAKKGTYAFSVIVTLKSYDGEVYGSPQVIFLNIE